MIQYRLFSSVVLLIPILAACSIMPKATSAIHVQNSTPMDMGNEFQSIVTKNQPSKKSRDTADYFAGLFDKINGSENAVQLHKIAISDSASDTIQYQLVFQEYSEEGKRLSKEGDFDPVSLFVQDAAKNNQTPFIIYFVHGWRNNSSTKSGDFYRFVTSASYISKFIAERCNAESKPICNPKILLVYVGWPGKVFEEPNIPIIKDLFVAATFQHIYNKSQRIGEPIVKDLALQIKKIKESEPKSKVLIIAHSTGGNIVMQGLLPTDTKGKRATSNSILEGQVSNYLEGDRTVPMAPVLGDLTVLINPASSAFRWSAIEEMIRYDVKGGEDLFPKTQNPTLISITSSCRSENDYSNKCDYATSLAYPLSQIVLGWNFSKKQRTTMGHYITFDKPKNGQFNYGVSHFIANNSKKGASIDTLSTSLSSLNKAAKTKCNDLDSNWLFSARNDSKNGNKWDTTDRAKIFEAEKPLIMQDIFSIDTGFGSRSIIDSNSPFWNAQGDSNTIISHGGYISYPLLCHLTQLWLDDVAKE